MRCIVTAGPTYEPLDEVRRLTNFSTGRLGVELANYLVEAGHEVTLLLGTLATWAGPCRAPNIQRFTTVADLRQRLVAWAACPREGPVSEGRSLESRIPKSRVSEGPVSEGRVTRGPGALSPLPQPEGSRADAGSPHGIDAVFHAAAVSDFSFGRVFERLPSGEQRVVAGGKLPTRSGALLVELWPTPKLITELRDLYPSAFLAGWKYEVEGTRQRVIERCRAQLRECRTDVCVANGPAYGTGFGVVARAGHVSEVTDVPALCVALESALRRRAGAP